MGAWQGVARVVARRSGTAATETFTKGSAILKINVAGGSVTMPDGKGGTITLTVPVNWNYQADSQLDFVMQGSGAQLQLVFSGSTSYFVEYAVPAGGE